MLSTTALATRPPTFAAEPGGAYDAGGDGGELAAKELGAAAGVWQDAAERMLDAVLDLQQSGDLELRTGLTLHEHLTLDLHLPSWLGSQLETVATRLPALPRMAASYRAGLVTFDQLAGFVRATRRRNGELLARLDEEAASLAAALRDANRSWTFTERVEQLVESLRAPGWADRQERRAADGNRVIAQQDLDGGGFVHADLDAVAFRTVLTALDDAAPADEPRRRGLATGLVRLAETWLAGDSTTGRTARATLTVVVDLATATTDRFADLLRVAGGKHAPTLSARLTDALSEHADLLVQLTEGRRPLAELRADDIPTAVRRAVLARDKGCRFPGCTAGPRLLHLHHLVPREAGGSHDPDNLIAGCGHHHLNHIHRLKWRPELDPVTAEVTWTRRGRDPITTLPHGTRRRPPPRPGDDLPDWLAPPRPPPPTDADQPQADDGPTAR